MDGRQTYRKVVQIITAFFSGISGVFLLSGAGGPGLRLLVGLICFISLLNLSLYAREVYQSCQRAFKLMGGQSAEPEAKGDGKKEGGGQAKGGKPDGGGKSEGGKSEGGGRPPRDD